MHGFRLHPLDVPDSGGQGSVLARSVVDAAVGMVDALMPGAATDIPVEEDAAPAMMMHWFFHPGSDHDFEHAHHGVFE